MNFSEYIKDKFPACAIMLVSSLVIFVFMAAFHVSVQLIIAVGVILLIAVVSIVLLDYLNRKKFYDDIIEKLDVLDKKYLISEMIENPDFYEAQLLREILEVANKSMCDNVAQYRSESRDFREFIEMWIHEVKLPIASLQLMLHNNRSEITPKAAEQLRRIDGYTDTVLYYARSENAEKDYLIKEVSLKTFAKNAVVKNREDILLHNIRITTEALDVAVVTDGKWLEFILTQLISNSIKYTSPDRDSEIRIYAEESDRLVKLHFIDNGIGIPEHDLPYIFDKSFTGENGRLRSKSTGMGLYIVKNLCEKLGNTIEAQSVTGEYTEFIITFAKNDFYKM